jgi:hypothetical protein
MSGNLFFAVGMARSGKSTACKKWAYGDADIVDGIMIDDNTPYRNRIITSPRVVVSADAIRLTITGQEWFLPAEPQIYSVYYTMIRTLLSQNYDVLADETNTSDASIAKLLEIDMHASFFLQYTSLKTCLERAIETNTPELVPVISRHYKNLVGNLTSINQSTILTYTQQRIQNITLALLNQKI